MFRIASARPSLYILVLAGTLLAAMPLVADIYKWVDDDGVTHYGQEPPTDRDAQRVSPDFAPEPEPAPVEEQADSADEGDESDSMEAYCARLGDQLDILATGDEVHIRRDDGALEPLEGEALEARRRTLQAQFDEYCA